MKNLPPSNKAQTAYLCYCKCKTRKGKLVDGWSHLQCLKCKLPILGIDIKVGIELK